jgi:hypothetical protein
MRLGKADARTDGDSIFLEGIIEEPVWWEYRITMTADDIEDIFDIATRKAAIDFIVSSPTAKGLPFKIAMKIAKLLLLYLASLVKGPLRNRRREG